MELDTACREQQVHDGAFASLEDVPRRALSLTIPFLMRVARAVAIVPGPAKTAAITAALEGPVTCACPHRTAPESGARGSWIRLGRRHFLREFSLRQFACDEVERLQVPRSPFPR